ncbi:MAG TPA: c-type cytochrome [Candidatus Binatia bacterium]|jgi:mono/diheme cytochrome c family protein
MRWVLITLLGTLLAGCAGQDMAKPFQPSATASAKPPRRLTEGEALYLRYCSSCHGWEARGDGPVARVMGVHPPGLRGPQFHGRYTEAELTAWVLFGDSLLTLPDPTKIASTEAEIAALIAHIKRLPQIDWENIDNGRQSYDSLCAYCHGTYGRGDGIMASAQASPPRDLSARSFQAKTSDEELIRTVAEGKGNMPGAKDVLSAEEIRSVVAYLRVLSPGYEM